MPPKTTLWPADPHTLAKHELLRRYLRAWLPIMVRSGRKKLVLIDGFAGPGRYSGGEPGSPLIMLDAFLSHSDRAKIAEASLTYLFIENNHRRVEHLRKELAAIQLPPNVAVHVLEGAFDEQMPPILDAIPEEQRLAPTFAFIDPFGYAGRHVELSSRILAVPRCEALIYVPLPHIARFVMEDSIASALNNLFGDDAWRAARGAPTGREREMVLHDIFLDKIRTWAGHARSFEMDGSGAWSGYHLFFGTHHKVGLNKMKAAMWRVDPLGGARFADSTDPNQIVAFASEPDLAPLRKALEERFGTKPFRIEAAEDFVLMETPFHPEIHLKTKVLRVAELEGALDGRNRLKARTYPPRAILRFTRLS